MPREMPEGEVVVIQCAPADMLLLITGFQGAGASDAFLCVFKEIDSDFQRPSGIPFSLSMAKGTD